jgi:hypothetical protein
MFTMLAATPQAAVIDGFEQRLTVSNIIQGTPDIFDALEVLKYLAGIPSEFDDNEISPLLEDAMDILRHLAGIPNWTPPNCTFCAEKCECLWVY